MVNRVTKLRSSQRDSIKKKKTRKPVKKDNLKPKMSPSEELTSLLKRSGPMLTSSVARFFESKGVKAATARQRISRLPPETTALKGLTFPKRRRFIYHQKDIGTARFYQALEKAIRDDNPPLSSSLNALDCRNGMMPLQQFMISCGCPIRQNNQISAERALAQLKSANLVRMVDIGGIGPCIVRGGGLGIAEQTRLMRAHMMAESFLLDAVAGWLGRMNMVSPNVVSIRGKDKNPKFSTCEFDLCGPSYLLPLTRFTTGKLSPGFMVADIILGKVLNQNDVAPFLRKCTMLKSIRNCSPFLPMIIADGFTPEALHVCRGSGIIATRAETLFGRDVAMGLGSLLEVLSSTVTAPPDRLEYILKRLSSIEGAAGNLRGALFEMVTSHIITELEGGEAHVGVQLQDNENGRRAEVDILLKKQRTLTVYECKGHQSTNRTSLKEVEHWLSDRIPTIYRALFTQYGNTSTFKFQYWTCGTFDDAALHALKDAASKTQRYKIEWKDGNAIKLYAKGLSSNGVHKHLAEHFFEHPLAKKPSDKKPQENFLTKALGL